MTFWLISLPEQNGSLDETWRTVQKVTGQGDYSQNYRFEMPMSLRVGGLDKLMELSDDLARIDVHVEGVVNKIRRQASDLTDDPLSVNDRPVTSFLTGFAWDEARYPLHKSLKEIVDELTNTVSSVDDDLKVKIAEYTVIKQQFQAANRKTGGSLAVKDLSSVVPKDAVLSTDNITTVVVTVPSHSLNEFKLTYETWSEMVVPRSAVELAADNEYTLMRVLVFRKKLDDFKTAARGKQCQTREYDPEPEVEGEEEKDTADEVTEKLRGKLEENKAELAAWCKTSFGDAFASWIHICAVRLFVESVLRYGLPPKFLGVLVQPNPRSQPKVRKGLAEAMGGQGSMWSETAGAGPGEEMYPYVSFTLDLEG